ncbi:hypothetical protein WR25_18562 [Diploscapter pachys]|uniref:Uncharacterized protein n=1 Tax=Diploscapter pachys TaxID=2018661 RepID=A0A2A2K8H4_9BILA|nr:hypothetical protein WR25_18562 [Diploscapter pachys]
MLFPFHQFYKPADMGQSAFIYSGSAIISLFVSFSIFLIASYVYFFIVKKVLREVTQLEGSIHQLMDLALCNHVPLPIVKEMSSTALGAIFSLHRIDFQPRHSKRLHTERMRNWLGRSRRLEKREEAAGGESQKLADSYKILTSSSTNPS